MFQWYIWLYQSLTHFTYKIETSNNSSFQGIIHCLSISRSYWFMLRNLFCTVTNPIIDLLIEVNRPCWFLFSPPDCTFMALMFFPDNGILNILLQLRVLNLIVLCYKNWFTQPAFGRLHAIGITTGQWMVTEVCKLVTWGKWLWHLPRTVSGKGKQGGDIIICMLQNARIRESWCTAEYHSHCTH